MKKYIHATQESNSEGPSSNGNWTAAILCENGMVLHSLSM